MGLQLFKQHFKIVHVLQLEDGVTHIGTGYVHNLISIFPNGAVWANPTFFPFKNTDLDRYWEEINQDKKTALDLLKQPDVFQNTKPVYTYKNGRVLKRYCEDFGYPNTTAEGELMYDNLFFATKKEAKAAAIRNAKIAFADRTENIWNEYKIFFKTNLRFVQGAFDLIRSYLN